MGVLFDNHCNDISSTAGGTLIEEQCGGNRRECDRKDKLKHRLVGEWMCQRMKLF